MITVYQGHVLEQLKRLAPKSVHACITSPPYWGLRDYGLPALEWPGCAFRPMAGLPEVIMPGCANDCIHEWGDVQVIQKKGNPGSISNGLTSGGIRQAESTPGELKQGQFCQLCGGWRGSLGLEPTPLMYVAHIVLICRELKRVLRDDGTFWLNLGDSYSAGGGKQVAQTKDASHGLEGMRAKTPWIASKQLLGIPWRVAFALQADGWFLRSDIIWSKGLSFATHQTTCGHCGKKHAARYSGSCMPESCRDRPTKSHEYVFLLSKSPRYYWDIEAVREKLMESTIERNTYTRQVKIGKSGNGIGSVDFRSHSPTPNPVGRNIRTVWAINPANFPGSHFATFSPALVEPMIKASTSEKGVCLNCASPWQRMTEKERDTLRPKSRPVGAARGISPSDFRHWGNRSKDAKSFMSPLLVGNQPASATQAIQSRPPFSTFFGALARQAS